MLFPSVQGRNLARQARSFPADFEAEFNLVFIAFQRWQQASVDTWLPFATSLEDEREDLAFYEFPTIQSMNPIFRTFINEGMRAGIPNQKSRRRTITLYIDKGPFKAALDMADEDRIYALLVRQDGEVLWSARGEFNPEKELGLREALNNTAAGFENSSG